ncbi:peptidylprolyl isomerase [Microbispora sp. NPDC049125]|uniref:peptidylprolyl isomerase n=1 Tax=Microbispora sp. NPDC049125 TaxID=3154929 RepID=UPI0034676B71
MTAHPHHAAPAAPVACGSVEIAAVVGERAVTVVEVEARLGRLRSGPLAGRLPDPRTAEGRNLRRWLVQVMAAELIVEQEAARLGVLPEPAGDADVSEPSGVLPSWAFDLSEGDERSGVVGSSGASGGPGGASGGHDGQGGPEWPAGPLTLGAALRTGGVAAAVLAASPLARALCRTVAGGCEPPEEEVRDYYRRNLDRFTSPETRWASPFGPIRRGEIEGPIEDAVFSAREGDTVGPVDGPGGPWTLVVERVEEGGREPYDAVRERIRRELGDARRERAFARWLDGRQAAVRLMPGYEHPADPAHTDATHRH